MAKIELDTKRATYATDFFPSDIDRAVFLGNPVLDNMMTCMVSLGAEVWGTRRRMYVLEAVLKKHGISDKEIETYMPSADEEAAWKQDRDRFIEMMFAPMLRRGDLPMSSQFQDDRKSE